MVSSVTYDIYVRNSQYVQRIGRVTDTFNYRDSNKVGVVLSLKETDRTTKETVLLREFLLYGIDKLRSVKVHSSLYGVFIVEKFV